MPRLAIVYLQRKVVVGQKNAALSLHLLAVPALGETSKDGPKGRRAKVLQRLASQIPLDEKKEHFVCDVQLPGDRVLEEG